jgi:hypothetical protein
MNESEFEMQLRADGYQEIELQELATRPGKGRRSAAWFSRLRFSLRKVAIR